MTATLLLTPVWQVSNAAGPISGATAYFYLTGTLTATPVYTDSTKTTTITQPVTSDSQGRFASVWLDPAVTYRVRVYDASANLIRDIDPVFVPLSITTAQIADGAVTGAKLGSTAVADSLTYTPLNKAGDTATGEIRLGDPAAIHDDSAGFRGLPTTAHDANYTMVLTDAGKSLEHTSSSAHAWTIPTNASVAYPIGTVINCFNIGSGAVTLTRSSGVTLRLSSTDANVTLAQYGDCFLHKVGTDAWSVSGKGLS